jgi:CRP-like cAMP-binding protein
VFTCGPATFSIIQRSELRRFLKHFPDAAVEIAGMVADRLRWANNRRIDFASYPVKVRLVRVLADLVDTYGQRHPDGVAVDIQLSQPELASMCGAAEATVQKALRDLRDAGVVETGYRGVLIRDLPALHRIGEIDESGVVSTGRLTEMA